MIKQRNKKITATIAAFTLAIFSLITTFLPTTSRKGVANAEEPSTTATETERKVVMSYELVVPIQIGAEDTTENGREYTALAPYHLHMYLYDNKDVTLKFSYLCRGYSDSFEFDLTSEVHYKQFSSLRCIRFSSDEDDLCVVSVHVGNDFNANTIKNASYYFVDVNVEQPYDPFISIVFTQTTSASSSLGYIRLNLYTMNDRVATDLSGGSSARNFYSLTPKNAYDLGYAEGTEEGYESGYTNGNTDGYENGYAEGEASGYENGYTNGSKDGYRNGYDVGYVDGDQASGNNSFFNLLFSIFDAPVKVMMSIFDFEIFGVNMTKFVFSILTLCIVLAVIRFFVGK